MSVLKGDQNKIVDDLVETLKGKIEGLTDPSQLREVAKSFVAGLIAKFVPGVGTAVIVGQFGAAAIEMTGELNAFGLSLDAAVNDRDIEQAAQNIRKKLAEIVVDKAAQSLSAKLGHVCGFFRLDASFRARPDRVDSFTSSPVLNRFGGVTTPGR